MNTLDCDSLARSVASVRAALSVASTQKALLQVVLPDGTAMMANSDILANLEAALEFCLASPYKMTYETSRSGAASLTRAMCDGGTVACMGNFQMQGEAVK
jgi:hypothetical protein